MSAVHLSDLMLLWLLTALFKYSAGSKLPGWVICPHGFPFSFCYHHRMWRLHSHEPEDVQFPQYWWRRWFSCYSQLADVSTGSFRAAPNSSASQASPEERWELTQKWIGSFFFMNIYCDSSDLLLRGSSSRGSYACARIHFYHSSHFS